LVSILHTVQSPSGDCTPGVDQIIYLISKSFYLHTLQLFRDQIRFVGNIRENSETSKP
jgi:hypothetical protein